MVSDLKMHTAQLGLSYRSKYQHPKKGITKLTLVVYISFKKGEILGCGGKFHVGTGIRASCKLQGCLLSWH